MSASPLPHFDRATLTPIVRRALGREHAEVTDWRCEPFGGSYGAKTSGVFHLHGTARNCEQESGLSWSVVLKVCRGAEPGEDPGGWNFGPREALAYPSSFLPTQHLVRRLLADRGRFLDALDRLPQTFCHNDVWRNNLFATKDTSSDEILARAGSLAPHIAGLAGEARRLMAELGL